MKKIFLAACLSLSSMICAAQNPEMASQAEMKEALDEQLVSCVKGSDVGCVARALAFGADANATNVNNKAALLLAAEGKSVEIVRLLLRARADVNNGGQDEDAPLCKAALLGRVEIVETLLEAGAKTDMRCNDTHGDTPLMQALMGALLVSIPREMNDELSEAENADEADENSDAAELREMAKAPRDSFIKIARLLIERGANVNMTAECGENALEYAVASADVEIVKEILAHGADVKMSSSALKTLRETEHDLGKAQYLALPALSKEQSASIAWLDKTRQQREEIRQLLRAAGAKESEEGDNEEANTEAKDLEALMYEAADKAFTDTIEKNDVKDFERLLNAYIAHPLGERVLPEALRTAVIYSRTEILRLLLARGVDPNGTRFLPLMHAVNNCNLEYVLMLLEAGADVNAIDDQGLTALDYAEKWTNPSEEHSAIIEALKAHGAKSKSSR